MADIFFCNAAAEVYRRLWKIWILNLLEWKKRKREKKEKKKTTNYSEKFQWKNASNVVLKFTLVIRSSTLVFLGQLDIVVAGIPVSHPETWRVLAGASFTKEKNFKFQGYRQVKCCTKKKFCFYIVFYHQITANLRYFEWTMRNVFPTRCGS